MRKLILRIDDTIPDNLAVQIAQRVIEDGLVSGEDTAAGLQYCYHTRFTVSELGKIDCSCMKRKGKTQTFYIYKRGNSESVHGRKATQ